MCARKGEKNDFGFCADDGNLVEDMEKERVSLLKTCEIKSAGLNFTIPRMTNRQYSILTCIGIFLKVLS